ncbi:T-box transcription factor T [Plecturocebus cupreus]
MAGLDLRTMYSFSLDFVEAHNKRWKEIRSGNQEWVPEGKPELQELSCVSIQPNSPNLGPYWMKVAISLSKVKINNQLHRGGLIMSNSLVSISLTFT